MAHSTLFPSDDPQTIVPAPERDEPVLWLKWLGVLPDRHAAVPMREVPFRRGLNIIQTRRRTAAEPNVVGHSVGKTLLMRLIRYSLGEQHFAIERVRTRIGELFRDAQVVTHWRVCGRDWIVMRPLHEGSAAKSFSAKSDDWRAAVGNEAHQLPFGEFLEAIIQATLSGLQEFTLPRARRPPKWLDVLGWLARDFECGYRNPNEWRHEAAESGPRLDRVDNSVILQWIADLMGTEEIALKHRHQKLLDERQNAKLERDTAQKTVDVTGPTLAEKLKGGGTKEPAAELDGLFAAQIVKTAKEKIAALGRLKAERIAESSIGELEAAAETARDKLTNAEVAIRALDLEIKFFEKRLETLNKSASESVYSVRSPFEDCEYDACPLRIKNRAQPKADPANDEDAAALQDDIQQRKRELPSRQQVRDEAKTEEVVVLGNLKRERDRLASETSGIDQNIGLWKGYRADAARYRRAWKAIRRSDDSIEGLDRRIDESDETQKVVRRGHRNRLKSLSDSYVHILKQVFGDVAAGKITVDGNGLHPIPDSRLAPNGAALSIMTTVLAFDVASMAASVAGNGYHPRLLIHDSPREGDMEEQLFHKLFQVVRDLETVFGDKEPSFQYIVTTTTPPPAELAEEAGPFVRLTLDARNDHDRLLRAAF